VTYCVDDREMTFRTGDDTVLACIVPSEPLTPNVEPAVAEACEALAAGDVTALQRLFVAASDAKATQPESLTV
jgi:hypothetical protein